MKTPPNYTTLSLLGTWLACFALALLYALCVLLQLSPLLSSHLSPHLGPSPPVAQQALLWLKALGLQLHHTSWAHLGLNFVGLGLLVWGFLPTCGAKMLAMALAWGLAWVAAWVLWVEPLAWYMGLSGALHAMLTTALILSLHPNPGRQARLALGLIAAGLAVKLGLEWQVGVKAAGAARPIDAWLGAPVAYEAHRGGVVGGLLLGLMIRAGHVAWGCCDKKG